MWQATVDPHLHQRPPSTHRQVWLSILWAHCSFFLGPVAHKGLSVPPGVSIYPVLWRLCNQIPWGLSVPLLDTQVGKSVVDPRTFFTVPEFLWYNCSIHEVNPKTITGHPESDQLPELTQCWERFRPARMEKPETVRRDSSKATP